MDKINRVDHRKFSESIPLYPAHVKGNNIGVPLLWTSVDTAEWFCPSCRKRWSFEEYVRGGHKYRLNMIRHAVEIKRARRRGKPAPCAVERFRAEYLAWYDRTIKSIKENLTWERLGPYLRDDQVDAISLDN